MQPKENRNDEIEIDLLELFNVLLHWLWLIILGGVLAGAIGFCVSYFVMTPMYESTTGIYILNKNDNSEISYNDTMLASQLTQDYAELIGCRYVLETVIFNCALETSYADLKKMITINNATNTRIIYITVKDSSPSRAQSIANAVREVASAHIKDVTEVEAVNVVDMANLPTKPCEPSVKKYTALGAVLGMFFVAALVILRHLLDDTIKTEDDIEKYLGLSTLAAIPIIDEADANKKKKAIKVVNLDGERSSENAGSADEEEE